MEYNFNGLGMNLGNLSRLSNAKTYSISAENMTGSKGGGARSTKGPAAYAARELGEGWKVSPYIIFEPNTTVALAEIEGEGAIQSIWLTGCTTNEFILRIYWDDYEKPSVECPVGAFFAYGLKENINDATGSYPTINSIPVLCAPNGGMNCFWEMPFRKKAKITVENRGCETKSLYFQINYTLTAVAEDCAYFHAQYRTQQPVDYAKEYTIVDGISGKGHYVGTAFFVGLNGAGRWWGEGEIKFYIDGDDKYPTICGTGTEDYFGVGCKWQIHNL